MTDIWDDEPRGVMETDSDMATLDTLYSGSPSTVLAKPRRSLSTVEPTPVVVGIVVSILGSLCLAGQAYTGVDFWVGWALVGASTTVAAYCAYQRNALFGVGVGGVSLAMLGVVALSPLLLPLLCVGVIAWLALGLSDGA